MWNVCGMETARRKHHFVAYFEQLLRIKLRARALASDKVEDLRQETFIRVIAALRREGGCAAARALWRVR